MRILFFLFFISCFTGYTQDHKAKGVEQDRFKNLLNRQKEISEARKSRIQEIQGDKKHKNIYDVVNGEPIYFKNFNAGAAEGSRTNYLQPDGGLNLNLEGENMFIGIWEVGGISKPDHVEFLDIENKIILSDEEDTPSRHATHVTGTILSSGIREDSKGMAPKSKAYLYDVQNHSDEARTLALEENILVSNHSYGVPLSQVIDNSTWLPGKYDVSAEEWDLLANAFPYYLPVFAAGNDGDEEFEDGIVPNFGKLIGEKNSKNTLTVGSANIEKINLDESGNLEPGLFGNPNIVSGFSSQGPTDDLRIKPDILGVGQSLISTSVVRDTINNVFVDSYARLQGTSMAAPNVSGTIILLQELHHNLNNEYMKASTMKALLCSTASDVGANGPDVINGWGLINAKKAAELLLKNDLNKLIYEEKLESTNSKFEINFSTIITQNINIGLVWNDPAGESDTENLNDTTSKLVNDLDIRLIGINEEKYLPWKLNGNDILGSAIKGDNTRDNVEIINVNDLAPGNYKIQVSYKNTLLNDSQDISLIISSDELITLSNRDLSSQDITFWPNPVKDNLNISSSKMNFSKDLKASIYDMTGKKVIESSDFNSTSNFSINVSSLSEGVYILNLKDNGQSIQKKIIKK